MYSLANVFSEYLTEIDSENGNKGMDNQIANLGITYGTPIAKIEAFIAGTKQIIQEEPNTRKENFHVVFNKFGDFNLEILVYVFLNVPDWSVELLSKQDLYLKIIRLAEDLGVEFAFPTQTLHVEPMPPNTN